MTRKDKIDFLRNEVLPKLVEMAIDATLPSDMNELYAEMFIEEIPVNARLGLLSMSWSEDWEKSAFEWVELNVVPTYVDEQMGEHLYSIDIEETVMTQYDDINSDEVEIPDEVIKLERLLKAADSNAAYFRVEKY